MGVGGNRVARGSLTAMVWKVSINSEAGGMLALTLKMMVHNVSANVNMVVCRC